MKKLPDLSKYVENIKETFNIAVVYAGSKEDPNKVIRKSINTRSWKSYEIVANDIAQALKRNGFKNIFVFAEGIDLLSKLKEEKVDLVWINSGGVQGINPVSHLPALLEMAGIPYIGHNPTNATVLDNKHLLKWGLRAKDIPTSPFFVWNSNREDFTGANNTKYKRNFGDYNGPFIVKPVTGRGSVMVEYVDTIDELITIIPRICHDSHGAVLVEKFLSGDEYTVAVMEPIFWQKSDFYQLDKPLTFSYTKRNLEMDEKIFTSMDVKPIDNSRFEVLTPANHPEIIKKLADIAQEIFLSFNLETLVRLDLRADHNGNINVLEANPKPDLKAPQADVTSLVCCGLKQINSDYDSLIMSILGANLKTLYMDNGNL
ncbi:D-alanine--D-alanine ligase family protein [Curvivirga aplysinae]|uniref:D-alanyl-alanine synthetase n=1 Tax=Curvivirga aplysinae TaxID=2529852 RepID=UPI0012BD1131|nr:D-alanyl-alanine synthetase [Curvivirga aplysinae]MTI10414.1 D-alanyl-alanine synthetase [Curvivirga aplysinae]